MKNILVLAGGGGSDHAVFAAAFGIAQPLDAHLEFFHVQVGPGEAAIWQPHAEFARGPAMWKMMQRLETECVMRTAVARDNFARFCERHGISITDQPRSGGGVSASWREEMGEADRRLMFCARHYDLIVVARPTGPNGLSPDLLERLLLGCGRPLLICDSRTRFSARSWFAGRKRRRRRMRSVPRCRSWSKQSASAGAEEDDPSLADGLADLSRQLA